MTEDIEILKSQNKVNLLGDARAEFDHSMLDVAFHEWHDYKSLLNANDHFIVVGRRGQEKRTDISAAARIARKKAPRYCHRAE